MATKILTFRQWMLAVGTMIAVAGLAQAQDSESELDDLEAEVEGVSVERLEVGFLKQRQSVQKTSATVHAFSSELLEEMVLNDPVKLLGYISNVSYSMGANTVGIRALGPLAIHPGIESNVGLFEDGAYSVNPALTLGIGSFPSEQYEIFSGPQDVEFGRGAIGGAINRVSKKPKDGIQYEARFTGGDYGRSDVMTSLGGSFTKHFLFRLTAMQMSREGVVNNVNRFELPTGITTIAATEEALGEVEAKYQEMQIQVGNGEVTRLWVKFNHTNQDNSPLPLLRLSSAANRGATHYPNQALLETDQSLPMSIARTLYADRGGDEGILGANDMPRPRTTDFLTFLASANPRTLNGIDDPWMAYRNFVGEETLDSTNSGVLHWDLHLGSYATFSVRASESDLGYFRSEDGDDYGLATVAQADADRRLDIRAERSEDRKVTNREARLGTRGQRTLSWAVGSYIYTEDAEQTVRARDASGRLASSAYNNLVLNPVSFEVDTDRNSRGLLSEYYVEVENRTDDTFAQVGLDFGGFRIFAAARSTERRILGGDSNFYGYTGGVATAGQLAFKQYADAVNRVLVGAGGTYVADPFGSAATALTLTAFNDLAGSDFARARNSAADSLAATNGHFVTAANAANCLINGEGCATGVSQLPAGIRNATDTAGLEAAGVPAATSTAALALLNDIRYLDQLSQAAGSAGVNTAYSNAPGSLYSVYSNASSAAPRSEDMADSGSMAGATTCLPARAARVSRCFKGVYEGDSTRAGVEISLGSKRSLYVSAVEGFKAGGFLDGANGRHLTGDTGYNPFYKSETVEGNEVGLKLGWAKFLLNISSFDYTYTDMQATHEYLLDTGLLNQVPVNIPEATVSGTDLELIWTPANWFQLGLNAGTLETEVTKLNYATDIANIPALFRAEFMHADMPLNNKLPNAPESQTALNLQFRFSNNVILSLTNRASDAAYSSVFNSEFGYIPEQSLTDIRFIMKSSDHRAIVTIYGENIDDSVAWDYSVPAYTTQTTVVNAAGNYVPGGDVQTRLTGRSTAVYLNNPQIIGVQFEYKF